MAEHGPQSAVPEPADWLTRADRQNAALTRHVAIVAVAGMLVISVLTVVDVVMRWLFNQPIPGFFELSQLIIGVAITAAFPAAFATRNNLTIDFLSATLSPRTRAWLTVAGHVLILAFVVILLWRLVFYAQELAGRNAITATLAMPVAPFWWVASFFVAICVPVQAIVLATDLRQARRLGSPPADVRRERSHPASRVAAVVFALLASIGLVMLLAAQAKGGLLGAIAPRSPVALTGIAFVVMISLVSLQIPLGAVLATVGLIGTAIFLDGYNSGLVVFGGRSANLLINMDLATIPLFIMMGGFASAAGLSAEIYRLAHAVVGHRRGGLAIATISGCAAFGAVTGSSVATAATIGKVALPEMRQRGYSMKLATGSVAAGGTLGMLIPPSTMIVVYAVLTNTSISKLFIAAIVPAIVALLFYIATVWLYVRFDREAAPAGERATGSDVVAALKGAWGVVLLFGVVIGGLYGGVFTATEAAAVGAGAAFVFTVARRRRRSGQALIEVLGDTAANTAMIYILVLGALMFSFFLGVSQVTEQIVGWVQSLDLAPVVVVLLILLLYLFLGGIMDPITMLLITIPVVIPLIEGLGHDLIWWGIISVMVSEIAMITPPLGINVFVIKAVAGDISVRTVFAGVLPFVAADILRLLVLTLIPVLTLWLPNTMQ